MKIQQTPNIQLNTQRPQSARNEKGSDVAFKGGESFVQFLKFLETNQAWGATAIDVGCMGIPRTTVDFSRGPDAGLETARREFSSTVDDALVGSYGFVAAMALAGAMNKRFKVKAHKMFVNNEMTDILGHTWDKHKASDAPVKNFLGEVFDSVTGFNPDHVKANSKGRVKIDSETQKAIVEKLSGEIGNEAENVSKDTINYVKSLAMTSVGSEHDFKMERTIGDKLVKTSSSLDAFVNDVCKMAKSFVKPEVGKTFEGKGEVVSNEFLKGLKGLNKKASIIGLAIATGIGVSLQPINMYLTRKKTGKTGFVGVEGREPDKTKGFKLLKAGVAGVAGFAIFKNIGKFSEILGKVQFKGLTPTIPQYKLVYGMTIISRLLSARDKNELRETSIKDSLGYVSWLILGGFVSKLTAAGFEGMSKFKNAGEKFIRYNKAENGSGKLNWLTKSHIVTRDEVLYSAFKKAGISTLTKDGKRALSFKELMKTASENASKSPEMKMALKKIKYLNFVQFAGYLYSGIVLGVGIPKLNISITKAIEKNRKAKMGQTQVEVAKDDKPKAAQTQKPAETAKAAA